MISPGIAERYGLQLAEIYRDAELRILARITAALSKGLDAPTWELDALARLQTVRYQVVGELARANATAAGEIVAALTEAYQIGGASALTDLREAIDPKDAEPRERIRAVQALAQEISTTIASGTPGILRGVDDIYRQVVGDAVGSVLTGGETRRDATQRALNTLTERGLSTIQTGRGMMNLPDYVQMAVRTGTAKAAIQGHVETMAANGMELVVIHPGPRACKICDRWAREILTTGDVAGRVTVPGYGAVKSATVEATDTLAHARALGFGHPNCRCGIQAFLPGITDPKIIERPKWDEDGYRAQQEQRRLEHAIRQAKTRKATALTPEGAAAAQARVSAGQRAMREHLAEHPQLKRQSSREQIGK